MRRVQRKWLAIATAVLAVVAALLVAILLRARAAPEPARLLPDADAILYFNLKPIRTFTDLGSRPVHLDPDYEQFVRETDFQFERDLNEAAFAIHSTPANGGPVDRNQGSRYSEVVTARFNTGKLKSFLQRLAASTDHFGSHDIYLIPHEGRPVRVSILSPDTVAASNTESAEAIHHIVAQYEKSALPFGGPPLLDRYYSEVPFGSQGWFIASVLPPDNGRGYGNIPLWPMLRSLVGGGTVVGSVRYTGKIQMRADAFISGDAAVKLAQQLEFGIEFLKKTQNSTAPPGGDQDLQSAFDSLKVERKNDRVTVTATVNGALLGKLLQAPVEAESEPPPATKSAPGGKKPKAKPGKPSKP